MRALCGDRIVHFCAWYEHMGWIHALLERGLKPMVLVEIRKAPMTRLELKRLLDGVARHSHYNGNANAKLRSMVQCSHCTIPAVQRDRTVLRRSYRTTTPHRVRVLSEERTSAQ